MIKETVPVESFYSPKILYVLHEGNGIHHLNFPNSLVCSRKLHFPSVYFYVSKLVCLLILLWEIIDLCNIYKLYCAFFFQMDGNPIE